LNTSIVEQADPFLLDPDDRETGRRASLATAGPQCGSASKGPRGQGAAKLGQARVFLLGTCWAPAVVLASPSASTVADCCWLPFFYDYSSSPGPFSPLLPLASPEPSPSSIIGDTVASSFFFFLQSLHLASSWLFLTPHCRGPSQLLRVTPSERPFQPTAFQHLHRDRQPQRKHSNHNSPLCQL
jgi:hypothetical protein